MAWATAISHAGGAAPNTDLTVEIIARPTVLGIGTEKEALHDKSVFGHAFIVMGVKTNTGVKEEVFGFYPAKNGTGVIKGRGMLKPEYRCDVADPCDPKKELLAINRMSESVASIKLPIDADQRKAIFREINNWNQHGYSLAWDNCVAFAQAVVQATGYKGVTFARGMPPTVYLASLKASIAEEDAQRTEDARRAEERRKAEEDARRKAEEEANRIPAGWAACQCPRVHQSLGGKWVRGTFYHPDDRRCP